MSNRTSKDISELAALKVSHEQQIAALTDEGLSDEERVRRFAKVAGLAAVDLAHALYRIESCLSPARNVWLFGRAKKSLFAHMPDCECPVLETKYGNANYPGIPTLLPLDWHPTRETLECFARVQQEQRYGE